MGVIERQSFKYSAIGYFGFIFGTISNVFLFPMDMFFFGKLRFILPAAEMLMPLVVMGLSYSNVKFYPQLYTSNKQHSFLAHSFFGVLINFIVVSLLFLLLFFFFPNLKESQFWQLKFYIFPILLFISLSHLLNRYISNFKRIAIPSILDNLFPKIANILAFCLFVFIGYSENISLIVFISIFFISFIIYAIYLNRLDKIKYDFAFKYLKINNLGKKIMIYSFFGFLGNVGNYISLRIDNIMISEYFGLETNGTYSTLYSIISLISVPSLGLFTISAPMINQYLEAKNYVELNDFHKKTSFNLFVVGLVLFSLLLVGFPFLTQIIKNGVFLQEIKPVLWILGVSMLFDMATGFNGQIITLSKYYKFGIVVMLLLAFLTVINNYLFIQFTQLKLVGISLATAISLAVFNLVKIYFNYKKFGVFPLQKSMIKLLIIAFVGVFLINLLPKTPYILLNLGLFPFLLLVYFLIVNYYLKIYNLSKLFIYLKSKLVVK